MPISYKMNETMNTSDVIRLFQNSGINRPIGQPERIQQMLDNANLVVTAWEGDCLVGIARALTDYCYCCYLSDLAVDRNYQRQGIGRALIDKIREAIGDETMLLLLSAPGAMDYYPRVGFQKVENGFMIPRTR